MTNKPGSFSLIPYIADTQFKAQLDSSEKKAKYGLPQIKNDICF